MLINLKKNSFETENKIFLFIYIYTQKYRKNLQIFNDKHLNFIVAFTSIMKKKFHSYFL